MTVKQVEIRDRHTFIPAIAIQVSGADGPLFRRAGFNDRYPLVILVRLTDMGCEYDPFKWPRPARTMLHAHRWITEHFDAMVDGEVIDVEFILNETTVKKVSEAAGV